MRKGTNAASIKFYNFELLLLSPVMSPKIGIELKIEKVAQH